MNELPRAGETNNNYEKELRLGLVNEVLNDVDKIVDMDSRYVHMDTSLPNYGLENDEMRQNFERQYRTILSIMQAHWWHSRNDPRTMPEIASSIVRAAHMPDTVYGEAYIMTVQVTSIEGKITRFASVSMDEDELVKIYDLFVDENGNTSALATVNFPDDPDSRVDQIPEMLSNKAYRLYEHAYYGTIPEDGLETILEYLRRELYRSVDMVEADLCIDELRIHSQRARAVLSLTKDREADMEMSDMEIIELNDKLKNRFS